MATVDTGSAAEYLPQARSLTALREAAADCRACPLWRTGTQTVFGQGARNADLMFVGEQPGDKEDLAGRPFVGPAGKLLDEALEAAGIDRERAYVTNAVKHFKWQARGKRRIHAKPAWAEVAACRPWLDAELEAVKPEVPSASERRPPRPSSAASFASPASADDRSSATSRRTSSRRSIRPPCSARTTESGSFEGSFRTSKSWPGCCPEGPPRPLAGLLWRDSHRRGLESRAHLCGGQGDEGGTLQVETPSLFAQAIQEHLELRERNSELETQMPLDGYRSSDPFENHPLFKTEEQARLEETLEGEPAVMTDAVAHAARWPGEESSEQVPNLEDSLWAKTSRDFDWGD